MPPKRPTVSLSPLPTDVVLWDGRTHAVGGVIPFYSHSQRSKAEVREDTALGIDRRVFSNLFVDSSSLRVRGGHHLMRHAFLEEAEGCCSESFFQAAKCENEADARFVMFSLSEMQAAHYGQGRLALDVAQKEMLVGLGVDPVLGFAQTENGWLRKLPRREDWEDVKADVMLHILRQKFFVTESSSPSTRAQCSALALLRSDRLLLPVEHTMGDRNWGDGWDGSGFNMLGKCIGQVLVELRGSSPAAMLSTLEFLQRPNRAIVQYSCAEATLVTGKDVHRSGGSAGPVAITSAVLVQLNELLSANSYLCGTAQATREDYRWCQSIAASSFQADELPHLQRWYLHISYFLASYPKFDKYGNDIPVGMPVVLSS